jgi:hypothetical protein
MESNFQPAQEWLPLWYFDACLRDIGAAFWLCKIYCKTSAWAERVTGSGRLESGLRGARVVRYLGMFQYWQYLFQLRDKHDVHASDRVRFLEED